MPALKLYGAATQIQSRMPTSYYRVLPDHRINLKLNFNGFFNFISQHNFILTAAS
jgi:hypothetical protein